MLDLLLTLFFIVAESWLLSVIAIECKREAVRAFRRWRVRGEITRMVRETFSELR